MDVHSGVSMKVTFLVNTYKKLMAVLGLISSGNVKLDGHLTNHGNPHGVTTESLGTPTKADIDNDLSWLYDNDVQVLDAHLFDGLGLYNTAGMRGGYNLLKGAFAGRKLSGSSKMVPPIDFGGVNMDIFEVVSFAELPDDMLHRMPSGWGFFQHFHFKFSTQDEELQMITPRYRCGGSYFYGFRWCYVVQGEMVGLKTGELSEYANEMTISGEMMTTPIKVKGPVVEVYMSLPFISIGLGRDNGVDTLTSYTSTYLFGDSRWDDAL